MKVIKECIIQVNLRPNQFPSNNRKNGTGCQDCYRERARTMKSEYGNLFSSMYQINDLGHGFFGTKYSNIFTNSTEIYALMA